MKPSANPTVTLLKKKSGPPRGLPPCAGHACQPPRAARDVEGQLGRPHPPDALTPHRRRHQAGYVDGGEAGRHDAGAPAKQVKAVQQAVGDERDRINGLGSGQHRPGGPGEHRPGGVGGGEEGGDPGFGRDEARARRAADHQARAQQAVGQLPVRGFSLRPVGGGGCIGGLDPIPEAGSCEWEGATSSLLLLPWTAEAAALLLLLLVSWELVAAAARLRQGCAETVEATPRAETERRRSRASEVLRAPPPREARRC